MLKIRFVRIGKKNKPFFRIAVGDSRRTPKGKFIEKLGYYNPLRKEKSVNKERVLHWISNGAQCSDTVHNLLVSLEIIKGPKRKIKIKVKKKGKEEEKSEGKTKEVKENVKSKEVKESAGDKKEEEKKEIKTEEAEKPADDKATNGKNQESEKIEKPANASDKNTEEKKEDKSEMKTEEVKEEIKTEGAKAPADDKIVADEKKEEGKQEK